jgi:hypothetical protein
MPVTSPLHSLDLWYYPPLMQNVMMELETTARGYAERLDIFNPTKLSKRKQVKTENREADKGKPALYFP